MPAFFLDSSALVKRYVAETGTTWVMGLLRPSAQNDIFIANITGIEVAAAISRRVRSGNLGSSTAKKALNRFKRDFDRRFVVVDLTIEIVKEGIRLAERHGLRGYDTTQLAVSLSVRNRLAQSGIKDFVFLTADKDLLHAAQAEGLMAEDPNDHF